ncbi:hypothetical protein Slin15195_G089880 [Septoria linicola]|uniref:Uncharacterized protein n=1 Tax=Septoria linicola TaxID=215465 RepID=A0A9Q9AUJ6_9PEZI|nr:hypothetical protein Slin15195_G089880 [Septoria linicola]
MATHDFQAHVSLAEKLDDVQVDVAEIDADLPSPQFERPTMLGPMPHEAHTTVVGKPHIIKERILFLDGAHDQHLQAKYFFERGLAQDHLRARQLLLEMDRMHERIEEYTEIIERKERESHSHTHEHEERKSEVAKLKIELTAALASVVEYKQKLSDRDCELGEARREIAEQKDVYKYLKEESEKTETTLEQTSLLLVATEERCKHAEEDAKRHECELRDIKESYSELESKYSETSSKYESTKSEYLSIKQSHAVLKKEKHEWLHEKGELEEHLRKCNHRHEETKRKLKETIEHHEKMEKEYKETIERTEREVRELHEKQSRLKSEKKELEEKIKHHIRNYEDEHCRYEDAEDRCSKWKLKHDHCDRELTSIREELLLLQTSHATLQTTLTKKTEEVKRITKQKDHFESSYHSKYTELESSHRDLLLCKETLRRHEVTIKEKSTEIHTLTERIEHLSSSYESSHSRCTDLEAELSSLTAVVVSLRLELSTSHSSHEHTKTRLHECETRYSELEESYSHSHSEHEDYEFQLGQLRNMLREVREEKERAIRARVEADQERDQAVLRWEERGREMERLVEDGRNGTGYGLGHGHHEHGHGFTRREKTVVRRGMEFRTMSGSGSGNGSVIAEQQREEEEDEGVEA